MKHSVRRGFAPVLVVLLFGALPVHAADFGVMVSSDLSFTGTSVGSGSGWNGSVTPWFSAFLGDNADLYVSAGLTGVYDEADKTIAPELFRTQLDLRFGQAAELKLGRIYYADPLGFIAAGLFDGAQFSLDLGGGSMNIGGWYTGLQYKKSANITMNNADTAMYNTELDYGDFYDTYFAPKRVLAALGFEHPALGGLARVKTAFIAQFDLNRLDDDDDDRDNDFGRTSRIHTQYITGKASVPLTARLIAEGGAVLQLAESGDGAGLPVSLSGAAEAGFSYVLTPSMRDRFSLTGRISSGGKPDNPYAAFTPVSAASQGHIFQGKLPALSLVRAEYVTHLSGALTVNLSNIFFFKDPEYRDAAQPFMNQGGYYVGNELFGQFLWSPVTDVLINLGGGAFMPRGASDPVWKLGLSATLAVY